MFVSTCIFVKNANIKFTHCFGMVTPALFVKLRAIKMRKLSTLQFCES